MDDAAGHLAEDRDTALALVADLDRDMAAIAESTAESPDDEHDAEGSTVGYERARVSALLDQARRRVAELSDALERVAHGVFGTCERCGGAISEARLEALPAARLCLRCAQASGRRAPVRSPQ
ncbi:MAG: TraR/DksA C4-type zinc finger protein [Acidimicrobiales bacterium]|jgi:RNA polymerase-binding transcription factor DksA